MLSGWFKASASASGVHRRPPSKLRRAFRKTARHRIQRVRALEACLKGDNESAGEVSRAQIRPPLGQTFPRKRAKASMRRVREDRSEGTIHSRGHGDNTENSAVIADSIIGDRYLYMVTGEVSGSPALATP